MDCDEEGGYRFIPWFRDCFGDYVSVEEEWKLKDEDGGEIEFGCQI